jgi:dolichol-phosphate mannosyltransferase
MYSDTTIVTPTFKEAENIGKLLDKVTNMYPDISVIVADDGSRDGTQEIVKEFGEKNRNVHLLDRTGKVKGLTASVLDGVMSTKTPFVVVIDADLQHPPEVIKSIVEQLRNGSQVVVGTRTEKPADWGFFRFLASSTAILLGRIRLRISGAYASDLVSGFFGTHADLFKGQIEKCSHRFVPEGYKVCLDLLKTLPRTTKVTEAPYVFQLRKEGSSKMGTKHVVAYFKSLIT